MARFSHRLAAGVGVLAAFFLLGGSVTVAVAEPGGSHSDRGSSSDRGNGGGNGRGGSERHDHDRRGNNNSGKRGVGDERHSGKRDDGGSRKPDAGDDGNATADPGVIQSPAARVGSGRVAADTEESAPSLAAAPDAPDSSASRVSESGTSVAVEGASPGGSGSGLAGAPSPRLSPPRVTVGNGREPRTHRRQPEPQRQAAPALQPAPAAPPPPPPPPAAPASPMSTVNKTSTPEGLTQELGVSGATDWSNPLWGLAGLLLIPAAGAALGYRQARAAHAAERLRLRRA